MEKAFNKCFTRSGSMEVKKRTPETDQVEQEQTPKASSTTSNHRTGILQPRATTHTTVTCMNRHLGPWFPLHSGVAQGCPISPLIFLVITEALPRMIVNDLDSGGVTINGVNYVITQIPVCRHSTLIGRGKSHREVKEGKVACWCSAMSMSEKDTKQEGQLLGKLNRQRWRAPKGIIENEEWVTRSWKSSGLQRMQRVTVQLSE